MKIKYVINILISHPLPPKININISREYSIQEVLKSYCREDWTCAERTEVHILTYTEEEDLGKIGKKSILREK